MASNHRKLGEIVTTLITQQRPTGTLLPLETVLAQAIAATRYYAGFCPLSATLIDEQTEMNDSQWALIGPLFLLYVERETALQLEAARGGFGVEPFGRSSSEIASHITQYEAELPYRAFCLPIIHV